jgi:hypothetical protein
MWQRSHGPGMQCARTLFDIIRTIAPAYPPGGSVRRLLQSTLENVVTRFTTPFGFHTTAAEVVAGIDLTGKKAIVIGGSGGIGAETARALAAAGASVTLAVRRTDAAKTVVAELRQSTGNEAIDVRSLDLSDLARPALVCHKPRRSRFQSHTRTPARPSAKKTWHSASRTS